MANEFQKETGDFLGEQPYRTKKIKYENPIEIIDSSDKCKVTKFKDVTQTNYAISKYEFARRITECNNVNYEEFSLIFDIIEKIIKDNQ